MTPGQVPAMLRRCAAAALPALSLLALSVPPALVGLREVRAQPQAAGLGAPSIMPSVTPATAPPSASATPQRCAAVPAGAQRIDGAAVQAWWLPEPSPLQVGKPFALRVTLCPPQARLLRLDAHMPDHRHGMNYRPSLQALGEGRWRAEGLLWHMPGRWEWVLDIELAAQKHRLVHSVVLR